eukprot:INCI2342.1.p1 GENE.INCI2342.1~~INCI2342.1.p1  ORF type:complete len:471 (+),score=65.51 INCI2342.1:93-1505(+)
MSTISNTELVGKSSLVQCSSESNFSTQNQAAGQQFLFRGGRRYVIPYHVELKMRCKGRWFDRTPLQIFQEDFPYQSAEYFAKAVETGRLYAVRGGNILDPATKLKNGDVVCHKVHRHEPSVPEPGLHVLPCSRDDIVAVSKGAIPVHSSGRYRRNTLVHIISQPPYNLPGLLPVHRLDRVTTGVCLLARTKAAARGLAAEIAASRGSSSSMPPQKPTPNLGDKNPADDHTLPEVKRMRLSQPLTATVSPKPANGTPMSGVELAQADAATPVRKEYLAKVCGIFPETLVRCDLPLSLHPTTRDAFVDHGPKGKPAITLFRRLAVVSSEAREPCLHEGGGGTRDAEFSKKTVGDTAEEHCSSKCQADVASIVLAIPLTGRTHQIRIHLQALGHPIVDDPLYSATSSVGSDAKQSAKTYKFADPMSTRQRQIRAANPVPAKISSDTTACDAAFRDNECCAHCPNLEPVDAYVA